MKHYNKMARQAGMTLIELTVVLLVLIGLAGLMIPYVAGFVGKTHDSTGTWNGAALDNNVQRYLTEKMRLPNRLEALINNADATAGVAAADCTGATANTVYCKMMFPGFFTTTTVDSTAAAGSADQIRYSSLNMAGINEVFYNDADTGNATFESIVSPAVSLAGGQRFLAVVGPHNLGSVEAHLAEAFERPIDSFDSTCYDYVVMGIGDGSDLIGATMNTAPVHFAQQGTMGPVNKYNRFVAVFQVDKLSTPVTGVANTNSGCSGGMEAAKFIGTAMAMGQSASHLWGTSHSLAHSWENIAAN